MAFEGSSTFSQVIEQHLDLRRRNAHLDDAMPLDVYKGSDSVENHPLFKTEEQARIEDTVAGTDPVIDESKDLVMAPAVAMVGAPAEEQTEEDSFWKQSRDFDWGD